MSRVGLDMYPFFFDILTSKHLLFLVTVASSAVKVFALFAFFHYSLRTSSQRLIAFFLIIYFLGTLLSDINAVASLLKQLLGFAGFYPAYTFFSRIVWAAYISTFQALALFLICLLEKRFRLSPLYVVHGAVNVVISFSFLYLAFFKYAVPSSSPETLSFELALIHSAHGYPSYYLSLCFIAFSEGVIVQECRLYSHISFAICPTFLCWYCLWR